MLRIVQLLGRFLKKKGGTCNYIQVFIIKLITPPFIIP